MVIPAPPIASPNFGQPRKPRRRFIRRFVVIALVVALLGALAWWVTRDSSNQRPPRSMEPPITPAAVAPGSAIPIAPAAVPKAPPRGEPDSLDQWVDQMAAKTEMPARALRAYAVADRALRVEKPACRLSWATLAGIGRIESNHNRYGGVQLLADGRPSSPIIGVPLDGSPGFKAIPDTDKGALDGDTQWDRAVGPMQFIPATWRKYAVDADGDGVADPQDIDDAAVAAGRFLCAANRNHAVPKDWWAAAFSYNNSTEYGQKVFGLVERYAKSSLAN